MDKDSINQGFRRQGREGMGQARNICVLCSVLCALLLFSCGSAGLKREVQIPPEMKEVKADRPAPSEPKMPDFVPVTEDISPLRTKIVDIAARNTPLRDVLHVVAEATGLNLIMEKEVNPETPITITLKNINAEDALNSIFSSADYFYAIKDNMLIVKAVDTRIFELGYPAVIQTYNVDVGGDILGGATGALGGTGTSSSSTGTTGTAGAGGTSAASTIKGNITQNTKSDVSAYGFWDAIEKSVGVILGGQAGAAAVQQSYTVNRLAGMVVVTATKKNIEKVEQYLNTVKKVINRQVLVEAKVIEVQLSEGLKYGIDWTFIDRLHGVGGIEFGTKNFANIIEATSPAFSVKITGTNLTTLMNALGQQGEVRTLSNPRVSIMNGQTALLSVGRNESFISKVETTTTTAAGAAPTTTYSTQTSSILSGVIIGIVPYINEQGEISLSITPIISDRVSFEPVNIGPAGGNQVQMKLPTVDLRELSTTVKVRDGQIIVIGGLISKKEKLNDAKVPVLGDVPLLGQFFTKRDKEEIRTELVVVLQPVLVSR